MNEQIHDERPAGKNFLHKLGSIFAIHEDEELETVDHFEEDAPKPKRNVVAFASREPRRTTTGEVSVFAPRAFADVTEIADSLRSRQVVIINLQGVDRGLLQRVVDFTSGVAYTLDGKIQKLSDGMYLVVPPGTPVNTAGVRESIGADQTFDFMARG